MCLLLIFSVCPVSANADDSAAIKTVRVGRHEPPYFITDESGRYSGYTYDYQQKIAAYTGWTYEYVEGSWPDLLQMLIDGKIDLMSDVSYTEERAELMQFSSLQMGAEEYYLYIAPGNNDITLNDYSTFNGKKVGVNANSYQKGLYEEWAATHELETEIVELTGGEEDLLQKLTSGEIDALVTLDVYGDPNRAIPLCKIGSSDFYFAVRNDRGDLLSELDSAMNLAVIAEGVENHVELQLLQKMGCDIVQGYYFSKPLPAAEFERLLKEELEKRFNNATL
jgi:ABC-type amino acid transport substrate-binding protein